MASNYPKGSEWRKWDLHVHTKADRNYSYSSDTNVSSKEQNDHEYPTTFIKHLYSIDNLGAIALTDHDSDSAKWIDKIIQANENHNPGSGREKITILPGVEIETGDGIHLLVIFNPDSQLQDVKTNFRKDSWKETIEHFLTSIRNTASPSANKTTEEILEEAEKWDAICIFAHVTNDKGFFKISSGDRKTKIYKHALTQIFQIPNEGISNSGYLNIIEGKDQNYGSKSITKITASDAKSLKDIATNNCWIKADPTFEGLKQIIYEPQERVYIGDEPEILQRIRQNKTKFISSIKIDQASGYSEDKGVWFNNIEIPLNAGLVAIIGNKGNGKSALTDMLALCGNSHRYEDFSFLREEKFLKDGLAKNFEAELMWKNGELARKNLSERTDLNSPERVRYLPQNFFERLTNNLETYDFEKTLEEVIFSYIPEEDRFGKSNFKELISYKKKLADKEIDESVSKIKDINEIIIEKESKNYPDYKRQLEEKLKLKRKELEEHEKNKPKEVPDPSTDPNLSADLKNKQSELSKLTTSLKEIVEQINQVRREISISKTNIEELNKINRELEGLKRQIENCINTNKQVFTKYGLKIEDIIKYQINLIKISAKVEEEKNRLKELEIKLMCQKDIEGNPHLLKTEKQSPLNKSLEVRKEDLNRRIHTIKAQLSEPQKKYQQYLEDSKKWEEKKKQIEGDENTIDTIKWLENQIQYIASQLNNELTVLRNQRLSYSLQIFRKKKEIAENYSSFKDAACARIKQFQNVLGEYDISIKVSLKIKSSFYDEFLAFIDQGRKGSFYGINGGKLILEKLIKRKDINTEAGIKSLLSEFIEYLENDKREGVENRKRHIIDQISEKKKISNFYEYIFSLSYVEPIYELKLGDKNLVQLSPGERGALLIVFYLLLDREDIPLIIDQPEENLDNESVYKILRHFIRHVKKERQVIIVTHNPNLAIVGDGEQIIFVKIDKTNKNTFSFESGSIENPVINKHASDVLEGTLKAFDVRRLKYLRYNHG
jgi:ABC-type lipoprotein export system ATPase subunit